MTTTDRSDSRPMAGYNELLDLAPLPLDVRRLPPRGTLPAILEGHVRIAHLPGILDPTYCEDVMAALNDLTYATYDLEYVASDTPPLLKFGPTAHWQFDQGDGLERYFEAAAEDDRQLRERFAAAGITDPLDVILGILRHMWAGPVEIPVEGEQKYFAGVVRSLTGGAEPHTDNARRTPDLAIGKIVAQGSILLYLRMPPAGGGMKVYAKRPTNPEPLDGLGWNGVAGIEFSGVTPAAGDVVIFPSTFVHAVEPVIGDGERVTISAFFGPLPDGRLVVWS